MLFSGAGEREGEEGGRAKRARGRGEGGGQGKDRVTRKMGRIESKWEGVSTVVELGNAGEGRKGGEGALEGKEKGAGGSGGLGHGGGEGGLVLVDEV